MMNLMRYVQFLAAFVALISFSSIKLSSVQAFGVGTGTGTETTTLQAPLQPDQADRQQQQQKQEQQQKLASFSDDEQQKIEPGQVSDSEANEATKNQLQQEVTTVIPDLRQQATDQSVQVSEFPSQNETQEQQQQQIQQQPEAESSRLQQSGENEVSAGGEQSGRKSGGSSSANAVELPTTPQQWNDSTSQRQPPGKGNRSMKRAFAGHIGVFGRKRAQIEQGSIEQKQVDQVEEQQQQLILQQQQQKLSEQITKQPSSTTRSAREYNYYQQQSTTRAPSTAATAKTKLKSADYPDYREILIQPDQAERQQQQQLKQEQQQQKLASFSDDEQQRIEPGQISDSEANEVTKNQLQQEVTTVISDLGQQATDQSVQVSEFPSQNEAQEQHSDNSPYIRLSNIATINSTGSGSANSSGEMKLMRIYVIDLDQKLVVGNSQANSGSEADAKAGINKYSNSSDALSGSTATTAAPTSDLYTQSQSYSPSAYAQSSLYTTNPPYTTLAVHYNQSVVEHPQYQINQNTSGYNQAYLVSGASNNEQVAAQVHIQPSNQQNGSEGYVLLDRDSFNGNLSSMVAHLNGAGQSYGAIKGSSSSNFSGPIYLARTRMNYTSSTPNQSAGAYQSNQDQIEQQQQMQVAQQIILDHPGVSYAPVMVYDSTLQATGESYAASMAAHAAAAAAAAASNSSSGTQMSSNPGYLYTQGPGAATFGKNINNVYYPTVVQQQQQQQRGEFVWPQPIAAVYPAPVQAHLQSAVPKYIAPQYNKPGKTSHDYDYLQHPLQQQPVVALESSAGQQQHYDSAPGQQQQVRYNKYNNNYTRAYDSANNYTNNKQANTGYDPVKAYNNKQPTSYAPLQDKYHAYQADNNKSHPSVYQQQQQQQQEQAMYQQQAAAIGDYSNSPGYSLAGPAAEPAQTYNNNNNNNKVTTFNIDGHWKPVDYSAPPPSFTSSYSQPGIGDYQQQQQTSINPAQYNGSSIGTNNNLHQINGYSSLATGNYSGGNSISTHYKDHDVVSLANGSRVASQAGAPNGYQFEQSQYSSMPSYGQLQNSNSQLVYQPATGNNYSVDGQHAPLNYQNEFSGKQQQKYNTGNKQQLTVSYVNTESSLPSSSYSSSHDNEQQPASVYSKQQYQATANDSPSQQVPAAGAHPSLLNAQATTYQYNGTGSSSPLHTNSGPTQYAADQDQQQQEYQPLTPLISSSSSVTNEYSPNLHVNGASPIKQAANYSGYDKQYSTTGYGGGGGGKQRALSKQQQPQIDQSYQQESPKIHSSHSSINSQLPGYKQSTYKQQTNNSPYLSVSGPPVSNGVYEGSDEHQYSKNYPPMRQQQQRPKKNGSARGKRGKSAKYQQPNKHEHEENYGSQQNYYQQQQQPETEHLNESAELPRPPQQLVYQHQHQPHHNHHNQYNNNRPPLMAVANYYRPSSTNGGGSGRGLLSWETISSVASGAAKRLPSLSSILMPFASGSSASSSNSKNQHPFYPTYQSLPNNFAPNVPYTKSAHYDGNVAAFHRPYPLRHMNHNGAVVGTYSDSPDNKLHQQQHSHDDMMNHQESSLSSEQHQFNEQYVSPSHFPNNQQQQGGSSGEASMASSSLHDSGIESGGDDSDSDSADSDSADSQVVSADERPATSGKVHFKSGSNNNHTTTINSGGSGVDEDSKVEVISDLADINDSSVSSPSHHQQHQASKNSKGRRPTSKQVKKSMRHGQMTTTAATTITDVDEVLSPVTLQQQQQQQLQAAAGKQTNGAGSSKLDSSHEAVLSSIEHQLSSGSPLESGSTAKLNRPKKQRKSKGVLQLNGNNNNNGVTSIGGEFVEPSISMGNHRVPINLDSSQQLPVDQQHLVLHEHGVNLQQQLKAKPNNGLLFPAAGPIPAPGLTAEGEPLPGEPVQVPPMAPVQGQAGPLGSPLTSSSASLIHQLPGIAEAAAASLRPPPGSPLASIQLGQYKITPQTQFVHNIIEPSRQMLSQYFKQYVGQLNQFAHGKK